LLDLLMQHRASFCRQWSSVIRHLSWRSTVQTNRSLNKAAPVLKLSTTPWRLIYGGGGISPRILLLGITWR
jgi:hypothetical protein